MPRQTVPVNRAKLEAALKEAEKNGPLRSQIHLWKAAAEIYNRVASPPVTHSVVILRVKEWGLKVKTQPGKRGAICEEHKAALRAGRGKRPSRAAKMGGFAATFGKLEQEVPERFRPLVEQALTGSLRVALKLMCLGCSAYQPAEIKHCGVTGCPLFPYRPYQVADATPEEDA
jgi:hypothetical protein